MKKKAPIVIIPILLMGWIIFAQPNAEQEVSDTLDALHTAEANGDITNFLEVWGDDAVFLGTDATEAWGKEQFAKDIGERFAAGGKWTFDVLDRVIGVDGDAAWFKEIVRYKEGGFILRPTGTMIKRNGKWEIVQLHMGVPIPNDVYGAAVQGFMAHENGDEAELASAGETLDALHDLASKADWDNYFALFTANASFIGTDATEDWTIEGFKSYASQTKGWTYALRSRSMNLTPGKNAIWFDELLDQASYGTSRGSGVLVRTSGGWKIAQYHLTFPVPNEIAGDITKQIRAFEKK